VAVTALADRRVASTSSSMTKSRSELRSGLMA
jgi:hypothetical protein